MLSRIAESLYWIGRYIERAENTARILEAHLRDLLEDPWVDQESACKSLLVVMGMPAPEGPIGPARVLELLAYDATNPSSVAGALSAARENARGARETVSSEMWECLNSTWHAAREARRRADRVGEHTFFHWVRERCSVMAGLTDATMSRDEGWQFLVLGRSLERVDMTARLLSTHAIAGGAIPSWHTLLRSCGAWETYLRTYRGTVDDYRPAEFLLLNRFFPRSVYRALATAEGRLAELAPVTRPGVGFAGPGAAAPRVDAARIVGRARTDLEYRSTEDLLTNLSTLLPSLQVACSATNDAVSAQYFRHTRAVAWAQEAAL